MAGKPLFEFSWERSKTAKRLTISIGASVMIPALLLLLERAGGFPLASKTISWLLGRIL